MVRADLLRCKLVEVTLGYIDAIGCIASIGAVCAIEVVGGLHFYFLPIKARVIVRVLIVCARALLL